MATHLTATATATAMVIALLAATVASRPSHPPRQRGDESMNGDLVSDASDTSDSSDSSDLAECPDVRAVDGVEPPPLPEAVLLRFQHIYMGDGARGNFRIRLHGDGALYLQKNRKGELDPPDRYEDDYPTEPTKVLTAADLERVRDLIRTQRFFSLVAGYCTRRGMDGGAMEILEVRMDGREHRVVVDRTEQPSFAAIREGLLREIYR